MSILLLEIISSLLFHSGDLSVLMTMGSPQIVENGVLRDGNETISGFTGVFRTIQYRLISQTQSLPKNLRVKEIVDLALQSRYPEHDFIGEREHTVAVTPEGVFSDLLALGTTDGTVFPPDFRQVVRQRLYLFDDEQYKTGRLLAIVAIERRRANIMVRLIWPSTKLLESSRWSR